MKNLLEKYIKPKLPDNEEMQKVYQVRWVWYHTILALELFFTNLFLFVIVIILVNMN